MLPTLNQRALNLGLTSFINLIRNYIFYIPILFLNWYSFFSPKFWNSFDYVPQTTTGYYYCSFIANAGCIAHSTDRLYELPDGAHVAAAWLANVTGLCKEMQHGSSCRSSWVTMTDLLAGIGDQRSASGSQFFALYLRSSKWMFWTTVYWHFR